MTRINGGFSLCYEGLTPNQSDDSVDYGTALIGDRERYANADRYQQSMIYDHAIAALNSAIVILGWLGCEGTQQALLAVIYHILSIQKMNSILRNVDCVNAADNKSTTKDLSSS